MHLTFDLKWSLWTPRRSAWTERNPAYTKMYDAMRDAFNGRRNAVTVYTAPRKEIRFGTVTVSKGKAHVDFRAVWDSPHDQSPTGEQENVDAIHEYFCGGLGYDEGDPESPLGARVTKLVRARSFTKLMERIDACETQLLTEEKLAHEAFTEFLKGIS